MAVPATRFIRFAGADDEDRVFVKRRFSVDDALCPGRIGSAAGADRRQFGNVFRLAEQLRHDRKRFSAKIVVETGADHSLSHFRESVNHLHDAFIHELHFVESHRVNVVGDVTHHFAAMGKVVAFRLAFIVGNHFVGGIAVVDCRFENHDLLFRVFEPLDSPDQFLAFSGEHRTADDFDPP